MDRLYLPQTHPGNSSNTATISRAPTPSISLHLCPRDIWQRYIAVQAHVLADSVRSFNSIHDRTKRCETAHIRDGSWMTNNIAQECGLDIKDGNFTESLWTACHQSFALERNVAKYKFGPNYVVCRTPLGNIRITTCFAGEREARIIDPREVEILEDNGCQVAEYSG